MKQNFEDGVSLKGNHKTHNSIGNYGNVYILDRVSWTVDHICTNYLHRFLDWKTMAINGVIGQVPAIGVTTKLVT